MANTCTAHEPGRRPTEPLSLDHAALGESITLRIARRGLTACEVAASAGINETSFSFMRRGLQDFTYSHLLAVAGVLETSVSRLVAGGESLKREKALSRRRRSSNS